MKKLSGLIIFIIVLGLIFTGFWFYQAQKVKDLVVYHLKEYEKPDASGNHVKVDDITVHGFPFSYEVNLIHPRYKKAESTEEALVAVDGAIKIGTDILGRKYWIKQDGDLNFKTQKADQDAKNFVIKGNSELSVDVVNPQYFRALLHPFFGLPKAFYKENPTFNELLNEIEVASYEDHDFGMYETTANKTDKLIEFSNGKIQWTHTPIGKEEEKFVFRLNLRDFEAPQNGKPLLPHLKKLMSLDTNMTIDIPYILGSGKNNVSLDFEATVPQNFNVWNIFSYKNIDIQLNKFEMNNLYGHTTIKFDLRFKDTGEVKDARDIHLGLSTDSTITDKGSEAIHRQFIDGIKLKVAAQPADPDIKVLEDLLKCCEDRLQDIIPDYSQLGKMEFIFDTDIKVKNVSENVLLDKVTVNNLSALLKTYGVKSHGSAEFANEQLQGKYKIEAINYKEMIHDAIVYYNRIQPIFEKFAEANKQPLPVGILNSTKEREILDFLRSISDNPTQESENITITIDFMDMSDLKIGRNSLDQVKQAWSKLVEDITEQPPTQEPAEASEDKSL